MKSTMTIRRKPRSTFSSLLTAALVTLMAMPVHAAVEVPPVPPSSGNGIPPNILFILDDSGSMSFDAMPMSSISSSNFRHRSYVHNTIYYNPFGPLYQSWMTADGTRMTGGTSYTAVYPSFNYARGTTIDLRDDDSCDNVDKNGSSTKVCGGVQTFYVPKDPSNTSAAYLDDINNFYRFQILESGKIERRERTYVNGWGWRNAVETTPSGRSAAAERANYAVWFSYHRTRMKVAKAGAAEAFGGLDEDKYRVGFTTIWGPDGGGADNDEFLIPVGEDNGLFRGDNREDWFEVLFDARGYQGTPLRNALKRAGEYYSDSSGDGPYGGHLAANNQQFQCRQNFSILTTDGFWNGSQPGGIGDADDSDGELISAPDLPDGSPGRTYKYEPVAPYAAGNSVTLADVAMAYWKKDLRTDMDNIVPVSVANPAFWQHMVTFGISIGLAGTVDQQTVRQVIEQGGVTRNGTALANWPDPTNTEDGERIDDLLHAAVNGRGEFVAATDPTAFSEGLTRALGSITDRTGSASNVAASSTSVGSDTRMFRARYVSGNWSGELTAYPVTSSGVNNLSPVWDASEQFPDWGDRRIYTTDSTGAKGTFPTATQQSQLGSSPGGHSYADYVKGDTSGETTNDDGDLRPRSSLLGDIIHSSPAYAAPTDTVYVGANDGMLHAFNGTSGRERFAYVPRGVVMSELKELASVDYEHRYFVDGPVVVSDRALTQTATHPNGRDLLVGTLGRGGKGVFALDVSNPAGFNATDVLFDTAGDGDMGLVTGAPIIAKLNDGSVSAIFGNGINSTSGSAVLWVINIDTGAVKKIDTGVGGDNGLSAPRGWDSDGDGDIDLLYAGDQKGNLWKFDLSHTNKNQWDVAIGGNNPQPLFTATDAAGNPQPITGGVSISIDPVTYRRWVFFGTGRLLNDDDLWNDDGSPNLSVQSMYGIIDDGAAIGTRAQNDGQGDANGLVERSIVTTGAAADGTPVRGFEAAVDSIAAGKRGWFVDLLTPPSDQAEGERIVGNAQVVGSVLLTSSIIPSQDPCVPGGRGYINAVNAFTGASVGEHFFDLDGDGNPSNDQIGGNPIGSIDLGLGMVTDGVLLDLGNGTGYLGAGGSAGGPGGTNTGLPSASGRISWREMQRR